MRRCVIPWLMVLLSLVATLPAWAVEKNMVFASPYGITTLDPSASYSTELCYMANIYEPLIRVNPPGSNTLFSMVLAESFTASPDGLAYTFKLRKGVKFHDGTPFTSEAVKFSIERTKNMGKGAAFIWADLKEIQTPDPHTAVFILKQPVPLPQIAASAYASYIMSPSIGDKGSDWFNQGNDAGTGPYTLKHYKNGESWMLTQFKDYWGGWDGNHIENILVKFTKEPLTQLQMLKAGQAYLVGRVPLDSYPSIKAGKTTRVIYGPSFQNYLAFFNTTRPPLDQVKVRQALAHAIPYEDIIQIGFNGNASQARGPVPQGQFGGTEDVFQYRHDLDKAKALLAQAGYPDGGFKLNLSYTAENQQEARFAPLIQSEFKKIGVEVEIQSLSWNTQWTLAKKDPKAAQDMFILLWWPTYSDPYETLFSLLHDEGDKPVWNLAYYKNPTFDKMIRRAYETVGADPEQALNLYVTAQNLIQQDAPVAPIADVRENWPMNKKLKGLVMNPAYPQVPFFHQMYIQ
ncbi:MAG: ABC transporter substrate-binding protein [Desulfobacterales bacterium]|nr:ABC transporter substrate-binding protein [Desulfobacterales bacterium]